MCPGSLTCQAGGAPAGGGDDAAVAGGGPALTARLLDPGWRVSAVMRERPVVSGAASYEILEIRAPRKPWWIMCSFQMKKVPVCRGCGARGTGGCPVCGDFFPAAGTRCPCRPVQGDCRPICLQFRVLSPPELQTYRRDSGQATGI